MSLAVLADYMASKGRNGDSMLVHMTPDEVKGLHALAAAHGGELTINPETGLPEANFLKKLLPTIIGAGISFFSGGTIDPMTAAMIVGGAETARTGDLGRGIAAGFGAYGGANLGSSFTAAGAGSEAALSAGQAAVTPEALAQITGPELVGNAAAESIARKQLMEEATKEYLSKLSPMERLSAGFEGLTSKGSIGRDAFMKEIGGTKGLMRAGLGVAAPLMAAEDVKAKMPTTTTSVPGLFHREDFDPITGTYFRRSPIRGASGGLMGMTGGGSVESDFAQRSEPVVRMAVGGPTLPSDIGTYTPEQKADLYNQFLSQGFNDAAIRQAAGQQTDTDWQTLQNLAAQRGSPAVSGAERTVLTSPNWQSISGQTGLAGLSSNIQNFFQTNPNVNYNAINQAAQQYGVDTQDIIRALETGGGSGAMQTVTTSPEWKSRSGQTGLEGLSSNINMWFRENPRATESDIRKAMDYWKLNEADILRATGKSVAELGYKAPKTTTATTTPTGVTYGGATTPEYTPQQPIVTPGEPFQPTPSTVADITKKYEEGGGSTKMPTITDIKPTDRTYTYNQAYGLLQNYLKSNPNAPYQDVVAFARSQGIPDMQARAAYNEFRFSGLTGGSKQAYDYLMGRGAYPTKPFTPTGEIMRPYAESVLGAPANIKTKRFLFDPVTQKYVANPEFVERKGSAEREKEAAASSDAANGTGEVVMWRNESTGETKYAPRDNPLYSGDPSWKIVYNAARGGLMNIAAAGAADGGQFNLGSYSDGGRLLRGPGDGVSDSIPATIGGKRPARLADGEFVVPARIVSELGNGSTEAGARKLYAMMDRVQAARKNSVGKGKVAKNTRADKYLPA
jgi:hypothetical protein